MTTISSDGAVSDGEALEEINSLCFELRDAALRCMDDLGPAHYKTVLAELRREIADLDETAAKWAWAGRASTRERERREAARVVTDPNEVPW